MNTERTGFDLSGEKIRLPTLHESVQLIRSGFEFHVLEEVANRLELPVSEVIKVMGISRQTVSRRKKQNRFKPEESNTLYRLISVIELAERVLDDPQRARSWMTHGVRSLDGAIPLSLLATSIGTDVVKDELLRIEYGVYS